MIFAIKAANTCRGIINDDEPIVKKLCAYGRESRGNMMRTFYILARATQVHSL